MMTGRMDDKWVTVVLCRPLIKESLIRLAIYKNKKNKLSVFGLNKKVDVKHHVRLQI